MAESRFQRIVTHVKEIFTTGNGYYVNEQGEQVYGKLPRTKVENPFKTVMRPTAMSALLHLPLLPSSPPLVYSKSGEWEASN